MTAAAPAPTLILPWSDPWIGRLDRIRLDRRMSLADWAAANVYVALGARPGRWDHSVFPLMRQAMDIIDQPWVREFTIVGPNRAGKTQVFLVIPLLRAIQEGRECLLLSANDDLAQKTWLEIEAGMRKSDTLRHLLLPARLAGTHDRRRFASGAVLHVAGANSIGQLAAFNAEFVGITELTKMPAQFGGKGGALEQARARSDAFIESRRIVRESVVDTTDGAIWTDLQQAGTVYRPVVQCPHCRRDQRFLPATDDGWTLSDPDDPLSPVGRGGIRFDGQAEQARTSAVYVCPHCSAVISEPERQQMLRVARFAPDRDGRHSHIGLWYSAFDVPWDSLANIAETISKARRRVAVLYALQDRLALPHSAADVQDADTAPQRRAIAAHTNGLPRGRIPDRTSKVTAAIDVNGSFLTWTVTAWREGFEGFVIDYGLEPIERPRAGAGDVRTKDGYASLRAESVTEEVRIGFAAALVKALASLRTRLEAGYQDATGKTYKPDLVLIDSGWELSQQPIFQFCRLIKTWMPARGFGRDVVRWSGNAPKGTVASGDHWRITNAPEGQAALLDADHWKAEAQGGFAVSVGQPGAVSLFGSDAAQHADYAEQVTAEVFVRKFQEGKGMIAKWDKRSEHNHQLDALAMSRAAAEIIGLKAAVIADIPEAPAPTYQPQQAARQLMSVFGGRR